MTSHHLNTVQGNVEYHFGTCFSGTVGYFDVTGTADPLFFPVAPVSGSANGSPHSNGYLLNVSWWPQQNIDLAVQYLGYIRFNGAGTNYDGAGRNAGANSSTYLLARFVFWALRRNLKKCSINGVFEEGIFRYARRDERERMDKDSGMAGVPGLSQRDQRRS